MDDLLPLPTATFHILLALADDDRHGYAIIQDVEARTNGELRLSAGTLYRSVARMVEQGLITEIAARRVRAEDERRRYYRITAFGAAVARAEPDGTTLTILPGGHAVSAAIYKQLPYNAVDSFSFISMLTDFPFILVTYPDHPAKTVADVIKAAQADEGKLTCATAGNGTGMHLAFELFVAMAKAKIQHIPYRGSPQGITDLLAKRVDFQVDTPAVLMPFISDGRLRPIAVTGPRPAVEFISANSRHSIPATTVAALARMAGAARCSANAIASCRSS